MRHDIEIRKDSELEARSLEQIVIEFLEQVNLVLWKQNMPVTGIHELDIPKLRDTIKGYALSGAHYPIFTPKDDKEFCGKMTYWLASKALDSVKWERVLELWYKPGIPSSRHEIVEATWEYGYDRDFITGNTGDSSDRVMIHNPEWVGKECGECCSAVEHFRRPDWVVRI